MLTEKEIAENLFFVLDDCVQQQYYEYQKYNGEYPSEKSIKALLDGKYIGLKSKALEIMNENLSFDILK